jgi:hypothetical protein
MIINKFALKFALSVVEEEKNVDRRISSIWSAIYLFEQDKMQKKGKRRAPIKLPIQSPMIVLLDLDPA